MKFSKAWFGLFSTVGGGLVATHYLAKKASEICDASNFISKFLYSDLSLSGLKATIRLEGLPNIPIHAVIDGLKFNLNQAMNPDFIKSLQEIPGTLSEACKDVAWFQGAQFCFFLAGVGSVAIYAYKKFNETPRADNKEPLLAETENDLESGARVLRV